MTRLVIFDLDGTLLNTIDDLATACNYALTKNGFPTHSIESYRYFVGNGVARLLERVLPEEDQNDANVQRLRRDFIEYYSEHGTELTKPYPGITELLAQLSARGIDLAVASNKYHAGTVSIIDHFFGPELFRAVYGQREGITPKPDPAIVFDIFADTGYTANDTLYIGDSGVDMQTARAAGIRSVGVTWGFRSREELQEEGAQYIVNSPEEILEIL